MVRIAAGVCGFAEGATRMKRAVAAKLANVFLSICFSPIRTPRQYSARGLDFVEAGVASSGGRGGCRASSGEMGLGF
jgi:hypothetical protein